MTKKPKHLPYGRQSINEDDIEAVASVLRSDYLTTGPEITKFESAFAKFVGAPHAITCNSATAALHLALDRLGVGPGDICIVPTITFLATANSAIYCGAEVVFADVDPATGLMTADSFEEALSRAGDRAKAVLPVHLAGAVCNMPAISKRARVADLLIVEDSCHALASSAFGGVVGDCAFSDAATFSFHPVKTMTSGEGGMITTRNSKLAERIAEKRSHGVTRDPARFENVTGADQPWWYEMQSLGWNYRMSDINAVLGRSQLARLGIFADRRRKLSKLYREALEPYSPMIKSPVIQEGVDPCRHLFNIAIDFETLKMPREQVMTALKEQGIGTQVHYIPVHRQPFYRALNSRLDLSGAERYYARSLSLPLYPDMDDDDPAHIVDKLTQILGL